MKRGGPSKQRYLRKLNPSVKQGHVEAVSNDCQTVQHANNWRAKKDINKTWAPPPRNFQHRLRGRRTSRGPRMTFLSFFAGVGGFDLGFQDAGMECLGHVEIDPTCQRVLERHWPGKLKGTDVTTYLNAPPRNTKPDVICGGFPCQDLSVAGKRKGLAGERSGLWFAFRDIIANLKPRWVVIENVPGLLSSHEGRDFALLLHGLAELGYRFGSRVLDSQYLGVPQRRRRVFIVGSLGDGSCVEVLFEPESLCGDSPPSRAQGKGTAHATSPCLSASGRGTERAGESRGQDCVIPTLCCPDCGLPCDQDHNSFSCHNCEKLWPKGIGWEFIPEVGKTLTAEADGSPDGEGRGYQIIAPTVSCKWAKGSGGRSGGGQMAVAVAMRGRKDGAELEIGDDQAFALRSSQGGGDKPMMQSRMGVRRLTPRECERLQGFPDDWTRWGADGKEISDSARYRMIGNAVTAKVAHWIGKQLMAVHGRKGLVTA